MIVRVTLEIVNLSETDVENDISMGDNFQCYLILHVIVIKTKI